MASCPQCGWIDSEVALSLVASMDKAIAEVRRIQTRLVAEGRWKKVDEIENSLLDLCQIKASAILALSKIIAAKEEP